MRMVVVLLFWTCTLLCVNAVIPHPNQDKTLDYEIDDAEESSPFQNIYGVGQSSGRNRQAPSHPFLGHFDTPSFGGSNKFQPNFRNFHQRSLNNYNFGGQNQDQEQEEQENDESNGNDGGKKIHKFISIHVAPPEDDEEEQEKSSQKQKPSPKAEKHYQIVFIKAPSPPSPSSQEIQLSPPPEIKTLVYVLLKKAPSLGDMLKMKPVKPPSPPEVYFIRYKGQQKKNKPKNENNGHQNGGGGSREKYEDEQEDEGNENDDSFPNHHNRPEYGRSAF